MDLTKLSEPLKAHQIDFRGSQVSTKGSGSIKLLAYKDARVDILGRHRFAHSV